MKFTRITVDPKQMGGVTRGPPQPPHFHGRTRYPLGMPSIFSRIVKGDLPCHKVWEDANHLAFLDLNPLVPGHTLVIPKREVSYIFDLPESEHMALWKAAHGVAKQIKERLHCKRVCVTVIGFEVPHAHIHLLPANSMAELPWRRGDPAKAEDLAALASKLRG